MSDLLYTSRDFARIREMIRMRAGIALSDAKRDLVFSRLARLVRRKECDRFAAYLDELEAQGSADDWQDFVNALTTNLTSFFREAHHFDALARHLRREGAPSRQRIWCCAASTGEEPWSLAITACEAFNSLSPPVEIVASDIDTKCLAAAAAAIYPIDRIEGLSAERRKRFFQRGTGSRSGQVRVLPQLRGMVRFAQCNVLDRRWPVQAPLDALFCRNIMIYFDKDTQLALLRRMVPLLRSDGLFFAGHSESFFQAADLIRPLGRTVYAPVHAAQVGRAA